MARVIDLKQKPEVIKSEPLIHEPEKPVVHPIVHEQKVFTDSGEKQNFESLRWTGPAFYRLAKKNSALGFGIALLFLAVLVGVFQQEILSTILFALMGVMVIVRGRLPVPQVHIVLDPLGIRVDTKLYRYDEIESFWIHYEPGRDVREVSFHMKKWTLPYLKIQLDGQDPVQVRSFLLEFIPEVKHDDVPMHRVVRWLGL